MYVNNTNIMLLVYNVYNYDYSFGENKNKRTLIVKLKETRNFSIQYMYPMFLKYTFMQLKTRMSAPERTSFRNRRL